MELEGGGVLSPAEEEEGDEATSSIDDCVIDKVELGFPGSWDTPVRVVETMLLVKVEDTPCCHVLEEEDTRTDELLGEPDELCKGVVGDCIPVDDDETAWEVSLGRGLGLEELVTYAVLNEFAETLLVVESAWLEVCGDDTMLVLSNDNDIDVEDVFEPNTDEMIVIWPNVPEGYLTALTVMIIVGLAS